MYEVSIKYLWSIYQVSHVDFKYAKTVCKTKNHL